nr:MAG TPA: hypothetical protein [Caudoviricetes sp.]
MRTRDRRLRLPDGRRLRGRPRPGPDRRHRRARRMAVAALHHPRPHGRRRRGRGHGSPLRGPHHLTPISPDGRRAGSTPAPGTTYPTTT